MKYNVGDKVRIVKKWTPECNNNSSGLMDKWLGKVMTIRGISGGLYRMEEDKGERTGLGWFWNEYCIEGLAEDEKKIVITTDGKETLARMYDGNKVVKTATAKCSPADTFDFKTGAELAFNRLFEKAEAKKDGHKFKVGDRVRRINEDSCFFKIGETGVVVNTDNSNVPYYIKKDNGLLIWSKEEFLELAPENPKYYNGKIVCIANNYPGSNPIGKFTVGKVYDVVDGVVTDNEGYKGCKYRTVENICKGKGHTFIPLVE